MKTTTNTENEPTITWVLETKFKDLTDEEIHQIFRDESGFEIDTCPIAILDFARAILKKASEK
jgi:hypothetical protein